VPLTSASLIGCGVLTGVGAVFNRAKVGQGESVVVIGVGGIGLNAIQGAALAGALPVIAVDTNPGKEAFARQFGATHFICPDGPDFDLVAAVKEICPNGVDYVFECVGSTALIKTSTELLDWGGTLVMLGVPKMGSEASFVVNTMYNDKTIMGCRYGSARPQYDIPLMVRLYQAGRLKLDELVSQTYPSRSSTWRSTSCTRATGPRRAHVRLRRRTNDAWHSPKRFANSVRSFPTGVAGAMTTRSVVATS
jgi:Zn-dependent alcohol dehydrogenase